MKIIGKGFHGIVLKETGSTVKKFYTSRSQRDEEKLYLEFVNEMNFNTDCKIPVMHQSNIDDHTEINGVEYYHSAIMDLIPGHTAKSQLSTSESGLLGRSIARVLYTMHTQNKQYIEAWKEKNGNTDRLWEHIFNDKAASVLNDSTDPIVKELIDDVTQYLASCRADLEKERVLSHLDLNLSNIMTDDSAVTGLVDWGSFGFTHPSISIYQLAKSTSLWLHIEKEYTSLGGQIRKDILYAATCIHVAWSPIESRKRGIKPDNDEADGQLRRVYELFLENKR